MSIQTFTDELAAVVLPGVRTRYPDLPRELADRELPASWVDMPSATIRPGDPYGTFAESGVSYSAQLFVAVSPVTEGLPDDQRAAMLTMAAGIEAWVRETIYEVVIQTAPRIPVGSREYRGVVVAVTLPDLT
jgi:hypothetical protein